MWRGVAKALDGEFLERGRGKSDRVRVRHENWIITLDSLRRRASQYASVEYTRLRAPFVSSGDPKLKIYKQNFFTKLGLRLGMGSVDVGRRDLKRLFVFKSDRPARLRAMVSSSRIGDLLRKNPPKFVDSVRIQKLDRKSRRTIGAGAAQMRKVVIEKMGVVKEAEELKDLFALAAEVLTQLRRTGSATPEGVAVDD